MYPGRSISIRSSTLVCTSANVSEKSRLASKCKRLASDRSISIYIEEEDWEAGIEFIQPRQIAVASSTRRVLWRFKRPEANGKKAVKSVGVLVRGTDVFAFVP